MRIVSLVPSLTDTLFALGLGLESVVGRTSFCVCPWPQVNAVRKVGGTKTPSLRAIRELAPDLVLLDREENSRESFEKLEEAGFKTHVTSVTSVGDVPGCLRLLGEKVERESAAEVLALELEEALALARCLVRELGPGPRVMPLIWREPLMGLSGERYGGSLLSAVGLEVAKAGDAPYPKLTPRLLGELSVSLLLLSSEPHPFTIEEGRLVADAVAEANFPRPHPLLVDGQALTWFGARSAPALRWWMAFRERLQVAG